MSKLLLLSLSLIFFSNTTFAGVTFHEAKRLCEQHGASVMPTELVLSDMKEFGHEIQAGWYWSGDAATQCNQGSCHYQVHSRLQKVRSAPDSSVALDSVIFCIFASNQVRLLL